MSAAVATRLRVCVTGANGFVASHVVQQLLASGRYDVVGTVRNPDDERKCGHLRRLDGAAERLTLVKADLLSAGAYDDAVKGCVCVMHTASPFYIGAQSDGRAYDESTMLTPAIEGTLNVCRSAAAEASVTSVVLTSSTASIYCRAPVGADHVYTEETWSDVDALKAAGDWYAMGKTAAERAAWSFVDEQRAASADKATVPFRLVVTNPTLVIGPMLQPTLNASSETFLKFMSGAMTEYMPEPCSKTLIDVRDVAAAHIAAMEDESAEGRLLLIDAAVSWKRLAEHIREAVTTDAADVAAAETVATLSNIPTKAGPSPDAAVVPSVPHVVKFDCAKALSLLGRPFITWQESLTETVKSLKKHGYVKY